MTTGIRKPTLFVSLWTLGFVTCLIVYTWTHAPIRSAVFNLIPTTLALGLILAMIGIGWCAARWFGPFPSRIDEILLSLAFGTGVTSAFVFALGCLGIASPTLYGAWIAIGLIAVSITMVRRWIPLSISIDWTKRSSSLALFVIVLCLILLVPTLSTPPVSTDALEYHLLIAKIHLETQEIRHIPFLVESNYPCLASYVYMLALPLVGDTACKGIHFWYGIALLVAIGRLTSTSRPGANPLLSSAFFISMPVAMLMIGWAWNDAIFVFFLVLALNSICSYSTDNTFQGAQRKMAMAGVLFGLAAWTKYTIVMYVIAFAALFLIGLLRWRWRLRDLVVFAVPVAVISQLVFVKNWLFTGNPFFPFLHRYFPSAYWTDQASEYFMLALRRLELAEWHWWTYFTFPFELVLRPRLVDVHVGVIPLLLAPLLFFRSPGREFSVLRAFVACTVGSWLLIQTETRSLLTLLAVLCCLGAIQFEDQLWKRARERRVLTLLVGAAIALNLTIVSVTSFYLTHPLAYFLGREDRSQFLYREAEHYPAFDWLNHNSTVSTVLLVGPKRPFYLDQPRLFSAFADPPRVEELSRGVATSDELGMRVREHRISHILVSWDEYRNDHEAGLFSWPESQRQAFETFLREHCVDVFKDRGDVVYQVKKQES